MSKFDLASLIREQGGPKLAADGPELREISVELIDDNDGNFYSTENVSDLMDSISVSGVLQPILVTAKADGRFLLLAGHRRTKAVKALRAEWAGEGANPYDTIPAMVKAEAKTETEQLLDELALIQTNAAVRKLSDPELARQADRMTEILTALKEAGYSFPGRMREAVAKAVGVSSSKIGRLDAIRRRLIAPWLAEWEAGRLTESAAGAIAVLDDNQQSKLLSELGRANAEIQLAAEKIGRHKPEVSEPQREALPAAVCIAGKSGSGYCGNRTCAKAHGVKCCGDCEHYFDCNSACGWLDDDDDDKPDDFVPVGRWFAVTDGVQPPEGALVLILRFSRILADWKREPYSAIYRDGKWCHVEDNVSDIEWTDVRYWSPWPVMEAEDGR